MFISKIRSLNLIAGAPCCFYLERLALVELDQSDYGSELQSPSGNRSSANQSRAFGKSEVYRELPYQLVGHHSPTLYSLIATSGLRKKQLDTQSSSQCYGPKQLFLPLQMEKKYWLEYWHWTPSNTFHSSSPLAAFLIIH